MRKEKLLCCTCVNDGRNGKCFYGEVRKHKVPMIVGNGEVHYTYCVAWSDRGANKGRDRKDRR